MKTKFKSKTHLGCIGLLAAICWTVTAEDHYRVTVKPPEPIQIGQFNMGVSQNPTGSTITLDGNSLRLDDRPWTPVMGEFHYARYPENEWREELLKMKAGGIDVVASYVFWIHHEEAEGEFDWSGRRNLRHFIETARDIGLKAIVRCGPWCHGEVRNGGLPDWILKKGWQTRSHDTNYIAKVEILYGEIASQLNGLLWKDGGPVIGIQLENEFYGPAEHLLELKRLARQAGLDVPLYTRTGWPSLRTAMPFGEIAPLYGVYAEGFWDRELTSMPETYKDGFFFSRLRADKAIASDILGQAQAKDDRDVEKHPYLTCEIGAGMMSSYHRRIVVYPMDAESTTLVKLGSGSVSPGYYMYHGGENPDGKQTTLMESQATGYWNDMPVKNYDFQTALGEYGQIRPQYHSLRRLHLFLQEWGPQLATMPATMPDQRPSGRNDLKTLRWCVRSDGTNGFIFVNNYQRLQTLPAKTNAQFKINLSAGGVTFPEHPVTIPPGDCFFWPFNLDLGKGVRLAWATAQPITAIDDGELRTVFFAETANIPAQFAFVDGMGLKTTANLATSGNGQTIVRDVRPGVGVAMQFKRANGTLRIVLLSDAQSLSLWKQKWQGRDRIFLTSAGLVCEGENLRLTSTTRDDLRLAVYPAPTTINSNGKKLRGKTDGVFQRFAVRQPASVTFKARLEQVQRAGPPREIPLGGITRPVAAAPEDADFARAAMWRVKLPANIDLRADPILRLHYVGDVARVTLDGKLLTDDFYNGNVLEVGLRRYAPDILKGELRVNILPLQRDAPIYLAPEARPNYGKSQSAVSLNRVEIIPRYQISLKAF